MSPWPGLAARAGLVAWALVVCGCATLAPVPPGGDRLAGRLSVNVDGDAARSFSAAFELTGSAEQGQLALSTPFGTQVARADWSPTRVRLQTQDGERAYADLDSLAAEALGERVPLGALFDWLRGRPWPGAPSLLRPAGFEQLGWAVDVSRLAAGSVEARRATPPVVTVRARLDS